MGPESAGILGVTTLAAVRDVVADGPLEGSRSAVDVAQVVVLAPAGYAGVASRVPAGAGLAWRDEDV